MEKIKKVAAEISKLGEELSNKLNKAGISLQGLNIVTPEVCKIDWSKVSTKTGADYQVCNYKVNPDLEFTPPIYIRLKID
ncbi:hypothetical protein [Chryseobacterium indologenes]|nr:hypothetical protein [Chryseobacterium indologenes]